MFVSTWTDSYQNVYVDYTNQMGYLKRGSTIIRGVFKLSAP